MNIGLLDIDGHNYPNLALMKISAWHKKQGDNVEFATMFGKYDMIYKSKVFTWTADDEYAYNTKKYIIGGTGYDYSITLEERIDGMLPDFGLYNCDNGYAMLTRGCIRKCDWCIVWRKEGKLVPYCDIEYLFRESGYRSWVLMDNNILASEYGKEQIEKIIKLGIRVDFNQGLDARLIDDSMAKLLSRVKWLNPLRLACDSQSMMEPVRRAVELLRWHNCKPERYSVYVLIHDVDEAVERIKFLKGMALDPFAQVFRDKENKFKPTRRHYDLERYVNHKAIFKTVTFNDYNSEAGGRAEKDRHCI